MEKGLPARLHTTDVLEKFFAMFDETLERRTERMFCLAMKIDKGMKKLGMNKKEFALKMKVQPSVISKWLSGTHNFTVETLFDIESVIKIRLINS